MSVKTNIKALFSYNQSNARKEQLCTTHSEIQKASLVFGRLFQIHQGQVKKNLQYVEVV